MTCVLTCVWRPDTVKAASIEDHTATWLLAGASAKNAAGTSSVAISRSSYLGYFYDSSPFVVDGRLRAYQGFCLAAPTAKTVIGAVHRAFRAATRNDHALIDRMLLPFDLSKPADYQLFLNIHLAALLSIQADWRLQDSGDFEQMLRCVSADLAMLGCEAATAAAAPQANASPSKGLGIAYVVRGSRLGAAALRRRVVGSLPTSYLDFVPALSWPQFLIELESLLDDPTDRAAAICAARSIFNKFASEFTLAKA